jgi:hypothetical protein
MEQCPFCKEQIENFDLHIKETLECMKNFLTEYNNALKTFKKTLVSAFMDL